MAGTAVKAMGPTAGDLATLASLCQRRRGALIHAPSASARMPLERLRPPVRTRKATTRSSRVSSGVVRGPRDPEGREHCSRAGLAKTRTCGPPSQQCALVDNQVDSLQALIKKIHAHVGLATEAPTKSEDPVWLPKRSTV